MPYNYITLVNNYICEDESDEGDESNLNESVVNNNYDEDDSDQHITPVERF